MPRNVEIKARVADLEALAARAEELAGAAPALLRQRDTFFVVPRGRLKLRELGDRAELIFYERADRGGPKLSRYRVVPVVDVAGTRAALEGALGLRAVVEKERRLLLFGRTRLHLDRVVGLGDFCELEVVLAEGESEAAGRAEAEELMERLGIDAADLVEGAYVDLL